MASKANVIAQLWTDIGKHRRFCESLIHKSVTWHYRLTFEKVPLPTFLKQISYLFCIPKKHWGSNLLDCRWSANKWVSGAGNSHAVYFDLSFPGKINLVLIRPYVIRRHLSFAWRANSCDAVHCCLCGKEKKSVTLQKDLAANRQHLVTMGCEQSSESQNDIWHPWQHL